MADNNLIVQPNIDHSAPVLGQLQLNNVALSPLPGTPLYNLISAVTGTGLCCTADDVKLDNPEDTLQFTASIINSCENIQFELQDLIEHTARIVSANIKTAQQEAMPVIRQVVEEVEQAFKERIDGCALNVSVVSTNDAKIWTSGKLETFLTNPGPEITNVPDNLPSYFINTPVDISELLKTNVASFDAEVMEWFTSLPTSTETLGRVWSLVFAAADTGSCDQVILERMNHNEQLLTFIIAHNLLNMDRTAMSEMTADIGLNPLLTALKQAENYAALGIRRMYKRLEFVRSRNMMVISAPTADTIRKAGGKLDTSAEILVDGQQYEAYLAQGGTPDALIGAVLRGADLSIPNVTANATVYEREVLQMHNIIRETAESKRLEVARAQIRRSIFSILRENCENDKSAYLSLTKEIEPKLETLLLELTAANMDDICDTVTTVVCDTMFEKSNVRIIIENINRLGKLDGNADVRELASKASWDYVNRFLIGQVIAEQF